MPSDMMHQNLTPFCVATDIGQTDVSYLYPGNRQGGWRQNAPAPKDTLRVGGLPHDKLTAKKRGLNNLGGLRNLLLDAKRALYRHVWGMDIHPTA
jgi:hypothetical protein